MTVIVAPRKYVQGRGVLAELGEHLSILGDRVLVLWDECVGNIIGPRVRESLERSGIACVEITFSGECTKAEAGRIAELAQRESVDIVLGAGGGKTLDTAKAAAIQAGKRMVTCPTIASNDSPTSALSVWYDDDGNCTGYDCWPFNPDLVLVDSQVIANAPVRTFVAGIGDALATWIEVEAVFKARAGHLAGGTATQAAMALAKLCFDILLEHGMEATRAVRRNVVTPAVEKVIEANVLLSGVGFESGGLATAHMVGNFLPMFPECHHLMHGEKVAFGIITQLCLEDDRSVAAMHRIVDFEVAMGLPVTFEDLHLKDITVDRLRSLGDICAGDDSLCANHPFAVTSDMVVDAMIAADRLGAERKAKLEIG